MNKNIFFEKFIEKYGLIKGTAFIAVFLISVFLIYWGLIHYLAKPGTQVSVWLFSYIKDEKTNISINKTKKDKSSLKETQTISNKLQVESTENRKDTKYVKIKDNTATFLISDDDTIILNALSLNNIIDGNGIKTKAFYEFNCLQFNEVITDKFPWLKRCTVNLFKLITFRNKNFYFSLYDFNPEKYVNEAIIIFEEIEDKNFENPAIKPIIFHFCPTMPPIGNLGITEPHIYSTKFGDILEIPCCLGCGSSCVYDYKYFLWNGRWILLDSDSWQTELDNRLPKGLFIFDDQPIDMAHFIFTSNLWKENDAHCCPTGGKVIVFFKIDQNKFKIDKLIVK